VGDETRLIASSMAGPSNIVRVGEAQARESLTQGVHQTCAAAGITAKQVAHTCIGGSGAARPELAAIIRSILAEILASPVDVVGDMETSLEAAFGDGPGVIVIAGTGSIAYGRDKVGKTLRAGGWGFEIGDEGSAHWIGRTAVSILLHASDRDGAEAASSSLAKALFKTWGVSSLLDLARAANSVPPPNFAALFRAVVASNDELSREVLTKAGKELCEIAALIIRRLFSEDDLAVVPVAMIGGVFRHSAVVREAFYNELQILAPRAQIMPQVVDPVEGALCMARKAGLKRI
jgi:glucosamine kinase